MKGIVNWYSDKKKHGLIEGKDGEDIIVHEKDLPFLTILHAGDHVIYSVMKTINGSKIKTIKKVTK
jgi:cold shock CspA family protein